MDLAVRWIRLLLQVFIIVPRLSDHATVLALVHPPSCTFTVSRRHLTFPLKLSADSDGGLDGDELRAEAQRLLARAKVLRQQAGEFESELLKDESATSRPGEFAVAAGLPWSLPKPSSDEECFEYRLYVDIGREQGTWMEPRWGASGRRVEFTLDVRFCLSPLVPANPNDQVALKALERASRQASNQQAANILESAPYGRLRSGFDRIKCDGGAYCIDSDATRRGDGAARFCILVAGTSSMPSSFGDVSIPKGYLYFSLPAFQRNLSLLSSKQGPVTIKQMGWNTGWWREESRIVGVFHAVPLVVARQKDGF